jgi:hypothetical protein
MAGSKKTIARGTLNSCGNVRVMAEMPRLDRVTLSHQYDGLGGRLGLPPITQLRDDLRRDGLGVPGVIAAHALDDQRVVLRQRLDRLVFGGVVMAGASRAALARRF